MKRKILVVEDTFLIQGWGPTIVGRKTDEFVDFKVGNSIEIDVGKGKIIYTKITSIPLVSRRYSSENSEDFADKLHLVSFSVEPNIKKDQTSKGANIWLVEN